MTPSIERDLDILKKREEFYNLITYGTLINNSSIFLGVSADTEVPKILSFENSNNKIKQYLAGLCFANNLEYNEKFAELLLKFKAKKGKKK